MEKLNSYPIVAFHGFMGAGEDDIFGKYVPYFGGVNGDAKKVAHNMGLEYYQPSIGGYSGVWDRACEMWAHLVGGTVDYGKVHSEKIGHKRYGRTYKALIPDWGKLDSNGKRKKINIIGHSFGGPSVRMFMDLVVRGSQEERAGTPDGDLSELFRGGKEDWIHTCTTLAGTLNGVTLPYIMERVIRPDERAILGVASIIGQTKLSEIYNFRLDQFGITDEDLKWIPKITSRKDEIKHWMSLKEDNIVYELSIEGACNMSKNFQTSDKTYYFAHHGCRTHENRHGRHVPNRNMLLLFKPIGLMEGIYTNVKDACKPLIDRTWNPNDCIVNIPSAKHPLNGEPFEEFDRIDKCKPGIWYWYPTEDKDHFSFNGIGERGINDYYRALFETVCAVPSVS